MKNDEKQEITLTKDLFVAHGKEIEKVLQIAVNHALLMHKTSGQFYCGLEKW